MDTQYIHNDPRRNVFLSSNIPAYVSSSAPDSNIVYEAIDPKLEANDAYHAANCFPETTTSMPVNRFRSEQSFHQIPSPQIQGMNGANHLSMHGANLVPRLPSASASGCDSPFPQLQSPTFSGAHSPLSLDSDNVGDGLLGPSTPIDAPVVSPLPEKSANDHWGGAALWQSAEPPSSMENISYLQTPEATSNSEFSYEMEDQSPMSFITPPTYGHNIYWGASGSSLIQGQMNHASMSHDQSSPGDPYTLKNDDTSNDTPASTLRYFNSGNNAMHGGNRTQQAMTSVFPVEKRGGTGFSLTSAKKRVSKRSPRLSPETTKYHNKARSNSAGGSASSRHRKQSPGSVSKHTKSASKRGQGQFNNQGHFICVFHFAGCNKRFSNKNEWKRHVSRQHINPEYWICTEGNCASSPGASTHKRCAPLPAHGAIFNRKDLFSQHVRRMHASADVRKALNDKKPPAEFIAKLERLTESARRIRCQLPFHLQCPVETCNSEWKRADAWDARMEHVGKHLEKVASGEEAPFFFGGENDRLMTEWAEHAAQVIHATPVGWRLREALKQNKKSLEQGDDAELEEDAEGEEW